MKETLEVGQHFFNQNDEEWVVGQRFDFPTHIDYTLNRVSDGELGFLRQTLED